MESSGVATCTVTYTTVIAACAKRGDIDRAECWFGRMIEKDLEPNVITFGSMIDSCAKAGNLARAEAWYERMVERGIAPTAYTYSAVMNACAKQGGPRCAEIAEKWLGRSEQAGIAQDIVLYSTLINAYSRTRDAEGALRIFNRMLDSGLKPDIVAYSAVARAFAQVGNWSKVEGFAADMARDGLAVNDFFLYAQLLSYALSRPQHPMRAENCFRSALDAGVQANDRIVQVLSRAVGPARCADLTKELSCGREAPSLPPRRRQGGGGAQWHAE